MCSKPQVSWGSILLFLFLGDIPGYKHSRGISALGGFVGRGTVIYVMLASSSWSAVSHSIRCSQVVPQRLFGMGSRALSASSSQKWPKVAGVGATSSWLGCGG